MTSANQRPLQIIIHAYKHASHHGQELTESRFTSSVYQFPNMIQALQAVVARCKEAAHAFGWSAERAAAGTAPGLPSKTPRTPQDCKKLVPALHT